MTTQTKRPGDALIGYGIALILLGVILGALSGTVTLFTGGAALAGVILTVAGALRARSR